MRQLRRARSSRAQRRVRKQLHPAYASPAVRPPHPDRQRRPGAILAVFRLARQRNPPNEAPPQSFIVTPTTSHPASRSTAAATDESTPPDMATTTRVSCGRPSRSRLLRIPPAASATPAFPGFGAKGITIGTDFGQAMWARLRPQSGSSCRVGGRPCRCPNALASHKQLKSNSKLSGAGGPLIAKG